MKKGIKSLKEAILKDENKYAHKLDWVLERAKHYEEKTGKTVEEIIELWENHRTYWYVNYYQDCNQPLLDKFQNIVLYDDWIKQLVEKYGNDKTLWAFKCPSYGGVQTMQDFTKLGVPEPGKKQHLDYACDSQIIFIKNEILNSEKLCKTAN